MIRCKLRSRVHKGLRRDGCIAARSLLAASNRGRRGASWLGDGFPEHAGHSLGKGPIVFV